MPEPTPRVRIVHQTNPRKYFPALFALAEAGRIEIIGEHRYSVVKEWVRSGLRERRPLGERTRDAWADLRFRLRVRRVHGETVLLGFAPWDWRVLLYAPLVRRNHVVYHTSWYDWSPSTAPRRYGPLTPLLRRAWLRMLRHPNVRVVAVIDESARTLRDAFGVEATVIPHAVPAEFFEAADSAPARTGGPLRLVYVGELAWKKGVDTLLALMAEHRSDALHLTLVGDGPMRSECERAAAADDRIDYLGPIRDRRRLAEVVSQQDVLALLSRRRGAWQELFGIVLAEAMAAGLGVVATNHIGPRSVLAGSDLGNLFAEDDRVGPQSLLLDLARREDERLAFRSTHRGLADRYRVDHIREAWARALGADTDRALAERWAHE